MPSFHLTLTQCASVPCCGLREKRHREVGWDAPKSRSVTVGSGLLCSWAVGVSTESLFSEILINFLPKKDLSAFILNI